MLVCREGPAYIQQLVVGWKIPLEAASALGFPWQQRLLASSDPIWFPKPRSAGLLKIPFPLFLDLLPQFVSKSVDSLKTSLIRAINSICKHFSVFRETDGMFATSPSPQPHEEQCGHSFPFSGFSLPPSCTHSQPLMAAFAANHGDGADVSSRYCIRGTTSRGKFPEGDAERQSHFVGCFVETVFLPLMDLIHFCDLVGTVKEEPSKIFFPSKFFFFFFLIGGFSDCEVSQEPRWLPWRGRRLRMLAKTTVYWGVETPSQRPWDKGTM